MVSKNKQKKMSHHDTKGKMSTNTKDPLGGVPLNVWRSGFCFLLGLIIGNSGILQQANSASSCLPSASLRVPTDTMSTINNKEEPETTIPALEEKAERTTAPTTHVTEVKNSIQKKDHNDGWQQVNVFYGQRLSEIPKDNPKTPKSFSQVGQDFKIVNIFGGPASSSAEG